MRIKELKILRDDLVKIINRYESKGVVMPSCINDLKEFFDLIEMPNFKDIIGDDSDTPCWKYVLDGGFDNIPDLKDAFEEFTAEIKGFRG